MKTIRYGWINFLLRIISLLVANSSGVPPFDYLALRGNSRGRWRWSGRELTLSLTEQGCGGCGSVCSCLPLLDEDAGEGVDGGDDNPVVASWPSSVQLLWLLLLLLWLLLPMWLPLMMPLMRLLLLLLLRLLLPDPPNSCLGDRGKSTVPQQFWPSSSSNSVPPFYYLEKIGINSGSMVGCGNVDRNITWIV